MSFLNKKIPKISFQHQRKQSNKHVTITKHTISSLKPLSVKYSTPKDCQFRVPSSVIHQNVQQRKDKIIKNEEHLPQASIIDCTIEILRKSIEKGQHINDACKICGEKIGTTNVAVLSCSHIFHYSCIKAFRMLTASGKHKCPICKKNYLLQRVCADEAYRNLCAVKIQKVFRGYLLRKSLEDILPQESTIYQNIVLKKASKNNQKLADVIENQSDAVDAFLASIDKELEFSRSLMKAVEEKEKVTEWDLIRSKVRRSGLGECGICLRNINENDCTITSCSHCFHSQCLNAWKDFCYSQQQQATCPMCRAFFQSRKLVEKKREFELPKIHLFY